MKKFYLGLVSLMLIMLHSCSQDELESTPINEPQAIKVVNIIDGNISTANTRTDDANYATMALQFSSEAEVQELLDDLKEMSIDERLKYLHSSAVGNTRNTVCSYPGLWQHPPTNNT